MHQLRVLPDPHARSLSHRFGPRSSYAEDVWLPVMSPTSFLAWRILAEGSERHPAGWSTTLERLAAQLGLGPPGDKKQAPVVNALRRLPRFGCARLVNDELIVVRCRLPFVSVAQFERLDPAIQQLHMRAHRDLTARAG